MGAPFGGFLSKYYPEICHGRLPDLHPMTCQASRVVGGRQPAAVAVMMCWTYFANINQCIITVANNYKTGNLTPRWSNYRQLTTMPKMLIFHFYIFYHLTFTISHQARPQNYAAEPPGYSGLIIHSFLLADWNFPHASLYFHWFVIVQLFGDTIRLVASNYFKQKLCGSTAIIPNWSKLHITEH